MDARLESETETGERELELPLNPPPSTAPPPEEDLDPTSERLESQIRWYDRKSLESQRLFKALKTIQIVSAAVIPVLIALHGSTYGAAVLGAAVVVVEGILQLNQYQQNWLNYRSTCEALRHEKFLFLAHAGPYLGVSDPRTLLAERIEGLVSQEHAKWVSAREEQAKTSSPDR